MILVSESKEKEIDKVFITACFDIGRIRRSSGNRYVSNSGHVFILEGLTKNSKNESVFKNAQDMPISAKKKITVEHECVKT